MSSLTARVLMRHRVAQLVCRFITAGLANQFEAKVQSLLQGPVTIQATRSLADWMAENFHFEGSKTPKGGKDLKKWLQLFHWVLQNSLTQGSDPEAVRQTLEADWDKIHPRLDDIVKLFSAEGGKVVPKEIKVGGHTYRNLSGFSEKQLQAYIKTLEDVFSELVGWRKKALDGGLVVALAGPGEFRGTSSGKYASEQDVLYVKATPKILGRPQETYASFAYIIVHELGHRYEYKRRPRLDFDKPEWWTSTYSRKEGESFAELFALTNFGLKGTWNQATLDRFEDYMTTGKVPEDQRASLPDHLKKLVGR